MSAAQRSSSCCLLAAARDAASRHRSVAEQGRLIVADYIGQVWRGAVFDNSYDRGIAMTAQIGVGKLAVAKRYDMHSALPRNGTFETTPASLPQVQGSVVAPPRIIFQGAAHIPARPETVLVARGAGEPLQQGTAIVQYYSGDRHDTLISSTWVNGTAASVPVGNAASATGGLFDGLVGLPVGSRVLIVAPGTPGLKQTSTTAVVAVDVLDQLTTAKQMLARS